MPIHSLIAFIASIWLLFACQPLATMQPVARSSVTGVNPAQSPTTLPAVATVAPRRTEKPLPLSTDTEMSLFPISTLQYDDDFVVDSQNNIYGIAQATKKLFTIAKIGIVSALDVPDHLGFISHFDDALYWSQLDASRNARVFKQTVGGSPQPIAQQGSVNLFNHIRDLSMKDSHQMYFLNEQGIQWVDIATGASRLVYSDIDKKLISIAVYGDELFILEKNPQADKAYKIVRLRDFQTSDVANLYGQFGKLVAHSSGLYVADYENQRVLKIAYDGQIFGLQWNARCQMQRLFKQISFGYDTLAVSPAGDLYLYVVLAQRMALLLAKIPQMCQSWVLLNNMSMAAAVETTNATVTISTQELDETLAGLLSSGTVALHVRSQHPVFPFQVNIKTKLNQPIVLNHVPFEIPLTIQVDLPAKPLYLSCGSNIRATFFPDVKQFAPHEDLVLLLKQESDAVNEIGCIDKTTFNGRIFDDTLIPLDGVKVTAKSLNSSVSFIAETTSVGGSYAFNNAPYGIPIEITASKSGYTSRRRTETLKNNVQGDPNVNKFDFGTNGMKPGNGTIDNALSSKPEVVKVTPGSNSTGVSLQTNIVIRFSEPMNRETVEDTFSIRAFHHSPFTVDGESNQPTLKGDGQRDTLTNDLVWDKNAFNITWNGDDTAVTFAFKAGKSLPSDADPQKITAYQIAFNHPQRGSVLKDKSGEVRSTSPFKLSDGAYTSSYTFSVAPDTLKPAVVDIVAKSAENQNPQGDAIHVRFNKPMYLHTLSRWIAGGMSGASASAPAGYPQTQPVTPLQAARNYVVTVSHPNQIITFNGTWFELGGTAIYDPNDETGQTILLLPPALGSAGFADVFVPGDTIQVKAANTLSDPAGNFIDISHDTATTRAN